MRKMNKTQAKELMKGEREYLICGGNCAYGGCSADVIKYGDVNVLVFHDSDKTTYYSLSDAEVEIASNQLDRSGFYDIPYSDATRQVLILNYFTLI